MAKSAKSIDGETNSPGSESGELPATEPGIVATDNGPENTVGSGEQQSEPIGARPESDAPAPAKRKRGRPPGTAAKAQTVKLDKVASGKRKPSSKGIENLAGVYGFASNTFAMRLKAPELVITDSEALTIANPMAEVLAEWGIHLDGAENPYLKLAASMMAVYAFKVMAFRQRVMTEKAMTPPAANATERTPPNPAGFQSRPIDFSAAASATEIN